MYIIIFVANTKYTGKGMLIAPNAKLNDGLIFLYNYDDKNKLFYKQYIKINEN